MSSHRWRSNVIELAVKHPDHSSVTTLIGAQTETMVVSSGCTTPNMTQASASSVWGLALGG